jgi:hypothetical protein
VSCRSNRDIWVDDLERGSTLRLTTSDSHLPRPSARFLLALEVSDSLKCRGREPDRVDLDEDRADPSVLPLKRATAA